jgi:hypothetical protein
VSGRFVAEHDSPLDGATPTQPPSEPTGAGVANDEDWLLGAREIALFMYGKDDLRTCKKVYHAASRGRLPCGKDGNLLKARRSLILEHLELLATNKSRGLLP